MNLGIIAAGYAVMSIISFAVYARDKHAARHGRRRTRERTLHLLDLLGGWPGGFAAQRLLRHKTRDTSFLAVFWGVAALHAAAWTWLILR